MVDYGQSSVEFIVVIGVALLVLAVMITHGEEKYLNFRDELRVSRVKASLKDVANSVDFVYEQGKGAKTRISVSIPMAAEINISTDADGTGVIEGTVYVRGNPSTFLEFVDANLTGSLPNSSGTFCIDIECLGAEVNISRSSGSC
jgi:uncharacterized protein (UPF0333 family)